MEEDQRITRVKELVGACPDFPKPGILFRDLFPVLRHPDAFQGLLDVLTERVKADCPGVEVIVGLDARGFLYGPTIALALGASFVPIRKKGKLPGEVLSVTYQLEYGTDTFEIQKDSIKPGQNVVIVDDLLATGGTMSAACELVKSTGGNIQQCICVIELSDLKGKDKFSPPFKSLLQY